MNKTSKQSALQEIVMKFRWIFFVRNKTFIAICNEAELKREGLFARREKGNYCNSGDANFRRRIDNYVNYYQNPDTELP